MKFKVGDKVRVKSLDWYEANANEKGYVATPDWTFCKSMKGFCGKELIIRTIYDKSYLVFGSEFIFTDEMLEENVVKEPLDLTKILEGCEGIELWSPIFGKIELESIRMDDKNYPITIKYNGGITSFTKNGYFVSNHDNTAEIMLYPSKEQRDWSKFEKPRWRAEKGEHYWYVSDMSTSRQSIDCKTNFDNTKFNCGNYFRTKEEAEEYVEKVREIFKERL